MLRNYIYRYTHTIPLACQVPPRRLLQNPPSIPAAQGSDLGSFKKTQCQRSWRNVRGGGHCVNTDSCGASGNRSDSHSSGFACSPVCTCDVKNSAAYEGTSLLPGGGGGEARVPRVWVMSWCSGRQERCCIHRLQGQGRHSVGSCHSGVLVASFCPESICWLRVGSVPVKASSYLLVPSGDQEEADGAGHGCKSQSRVLLVPKDE